MLKDVKNDERFRSTWPSSEPAQQIAKIKEHSFEWKILNSAKQWKLRKVKELFTLQI